MFDHANWCTYRKKIDVYISYLKSQMNNRKKSNRIRNEACNSHFAWRWYQISSGFLSNRTTLVPYIEFPVKKWDTFCRIILLGHLRRRWWKTSLEANHVRSDKDKYKVAFFIFWLLRNALLESCRVTNLCPHKNDYVISRIWKRKCPILLSRKKPWKNRYYVCKYLKNK